ncbi:MAG: hypothetical protein LC667_15615, partial [Thioalkalivibrio sp.]|nr:hypothetical protein [Thioalkalivibrio sp.]
AQAAFDGSEPDIRIFHETVHDLPRAYTFGLGEDAFHIGIPGVGRFLIRDGCEIRIGAPDGGDRAELCLWLLGSTMGALLHQRGALPLHASAVAVRDGCVAFVGSCGAGKSTLCAALAYRGYAVVSDDVLTVTRTACGRLQGAPGSATLRLKADALAAFAHAASAPRAGGGHEGKHLVQPPRISAKPLALRSVYVLHNAADGGVGAVEEVVGINAFKAILANVYRPQFAAALGCFERTFALSAAVAHEVTVYRLVRSRSFRLLPDVLALLEAHWSGAFTQGP